VKRHENKGLAVTMRDVAQTSGYSPATVSIVLNNAPLARYNRSRDEKKRSKKRPRSWAIDRMPWRDFLRSKRSHSVGVMFFDITDPFCTPILRGIENALYQCS